jgi:hypothetical protein
VNFRIEKYTSLKTIGPSLIFFLLQLLVISKLTAQDTINCSSGNLSFKVGEEIDYMVYYNWGPIWVNAGHVEFRVYERYYRGRPVFHFYSYGQSHRRYDWLFKVRDKFESYADKETFRPVWYEMDTYEGGFISKDIYHFSHSDNRVVVTTEDSDKPMKTDTLDVKPCTFDVLTAIYAARNLDFTSFSINESVPFSILIRDTVYDLNPRYLGKETITTREDETYACIKFSVELVEGFIFSPGNEMFVWVTDDRNRVPVLVEAQIRIGSVKAMLLSTYGLRSN